MFHCAGFLKSERLVWADRLKVWKVRDPVAWKVMANSRNEDGALGTRSTSRLKLRHKLRRTFDFCSVSSGATGVEVLSLAS